MIDKTSVERATYANRAFLYFLIISLAAAYLVDANLTSSISPNNELELITSKLHGAVRDKPLSLNLQKERDAFHEQKTGKDSNASVSAAVHRENVIKLAALLKKVHLGEYPQSDTVLGRPEVKAELDSLSLLNASGQEPSVRIDSSGNILSVTGNFQLLTENSPGFSVAPGVISLIDKHRTLFGLGALERGIPESDIKTNSRGEKVVRVNRQFKGLPVWGRQIVVTTKNNQAVSITGKFLPISSDVDTSARLDESQLSLMVSDALADKTYTTDLIQSIERGIYIYADMPLYAYKVVTGKPFGRNWELYFSPHNEQLIIKVPLFSSVSTPSNGRDLTGTIRNFNSFYRNGSYELEDNSFPRNSRSGIYAWRAEDPDNSSLAKYSYSTGWDPAAVSAIYHLRQTNNYFSETHSRSSFDGTGKPLVAVVNADIDKVRGENRYQCNAEWRQSSAIGFMLLGTGGYCSGGRWNNFAISLDIVAHEFTHGVVRETAGLPYRNQQGALDESFADFFGAMVDRDDWFVGEDLLSNSYIRSMSNPAAKGQPAHMRDFRKKPLSDDYGGVHTNSGIPNKALYLIADGLTKEGLGTSIGREKTEELVYATLDTLASDAEFVDAANTMILRAESKYGADSNEYRAVADAWDAVGVISLAVETEGGSKTNELETGDDVLVHLSPRDGTMNDLWSIREEYDVYVQTIKNPFGGHLSSGQYGPLNGDPVKGSKPTLSTLSSGDLVVSYIGKDNKARIKRVSADNSFEEQIWEVENLNKVALSPDGYMFAWVYESSNKIYVYNFTKESLTTVQVEGPSYSQSGERRLVKRVDAINFDSTGYKLVFDYEVCIPSFGQSCQDAWSVGIYDIGTESFIYPYSANSANITLGFPRFSNKRNDIIAVDYVDWTDSQSEGKAKSYTLIYDLTNRMTLASFGTNSGERRQSAFGIPSFVGEDRAIALQAQDDTSTGLYHCALNNDYSRNPDSCLKIAPMDAGFGQAHRNAFKEITAILETNKSSIALGDFVAGEKGLANVVLTNNGNRELAITSVIESDPSIFTNLTNRILLPGESVRFSITLTSSNEIAGLFSGSITLTHSGDNGDMVIGLSAFVEADTDSDGVGNDLDDDDDGDGVPDANDDLPLDASETTDTDFDGIGNNADNDDDGDGISDSQEAIDGTDPLKVDTDGDGLSDSEESTYGTNPLLADTDGDDYLDGEEVDSGADPLDANDNPSEGLNWHVFKAAKDQQEAASE